MFPQLTDAQIDHVIEEVKQYVKLNPAARASAGDYKNQTVVPSINQVHVR